MLSKQNRIYKLNIPLSTCGEGAGGEVYDTTGTT
jgi:hypothetical protein